MNQPAPAGATDRRRRGCTVAGCRRAHYGLGLCRPHWRRALRGRDVHQEEPLAVRDGVGAGAYSSALRRVTAAQGPAAALACAECARPARVWSYDGADPAERTDPARGYRYSLDQARYRPRCRSCHRRAAGPAGAGPLDIERAAWLYRAGASSRGIAALLDASPSAVLRALRAHGVPIRHHGSQPR